MTQLCLWHSLVLLAALFLSINCHLFSKSFWTTLALLFLLLHYFTWVSRWWEIWRKVLALHSLFHSYSLLLRRKFCNFYYTVLVNVILKWKSFWNISKCGFLSVFHCHGFHRVFSLGVENISCSILLHAPSCTILQKPIKMLYIIQCSLYICINWL